VRGVHAGEVLLQGVPAGGLEEAPGDLQEAAAAAAAAAATGAIEAEIQVQQQRCNELLSIHLAVSTCRHIPMPFTIFLQAFYRRKLLGCMWTEGGIRVLTEYQISIDQVMHAIYDNALLLINTVVVSR
jgi:hypothetical protein